MTTMSVRLPESLHRKARELAEREGVSINQLVATALAEAATAKLPLLMKLAVPPLACWLTPKASAPAFAAVAPVAFATAAMSMLPLLSSVTTEPVAFW